MNSSTSTRMSSAESTERFSVESKSGQTESYVLDIPTETFRKLWFNPNFDLSRVIPSFIKSHEVLKGKKRSEGSVERIEYCDGTFSEFETKKSDEKELESMYEILKTDIPFLKDVEKVTHMFRFTPITFSGCPFEQALFDEESRKKSSMKPSSRVMVEWTTRFSSEASSE